MKEHCRAILLLLTAGTSITSGTPGQSCDASRHPEQPSTRLKKELFCNYDALERPVKDYSNTTDVDVFVVLQSLDVIRSSTGNIADIHTWTVWSWTDVFLTWDKKDHPGIDFVYVNAGSLWVPDIVVQSREISSMSDFLLDGVCAVHASGTVICIGYVTYQTVCVSDMSWPFEAQTCEFMFSTVYSTHNTHKNVNISFRGTGYETPDYVPNREWQLLGVEVTREERVLQSDKSLRSLTYKLMMKMHSTFFASTILTLAFVFFVMTAASFWINPESPARLSLCCMNVLIQCLYLEYLNFATVSNGDACPRIILFFRDLMLLATMSLMLAVIALRLSCDGEAPPAWCSRILHWMTDNRVGQVLLASSFVNEEQTTTQAPPVDEEAANIIREAQDISRIKHLEKWPALICVLDRVVFSVFSCTFFILLIVRFA